MQNKKEKVVMDAIYASASKKTGQCLLTPVELMQKIPLKVAIKSDELDGIVEALSLDGYYDYEKATHKGDEVYCFTLKEAGLSYERDKKAKRKKLYIKIATTVAFALLGYLVKVIVSQFIG